MSLYGFFALLVVGLTGIFSQSYQGRKILARRLPGIFLFSIVIIFALAGYFTFKQYLAWSHDSLGQFLLPPHQSFTYFLSYSLVKFFGPYLVSLFVALAFLKLTLDFNKKRGEIFFEKEEPYLAALAFFLVGYPGWFVYLIVLILVYLTLHTSHFILRPGTRRYPVRLPLYHLWAPTAFFAILLNEYWLAKMSWWQFLLI